MDTASNIIDPGEVSHQDHHADPATENIVKAQEDRFKASCKSNAGVIWRGVKANLIKYHLLWLLILGVAIGAAWPLPGQTLGDARLGSGLCLLTSNHTTRGEQPVCVWSTLSNLCVTIIFLISGMQLKLDKATKKAFKKPKAIALGYVLIYGITGAFGFAVAAGPRLNPPEFSFGMALFTIMPTTLAVCVVVVGYAKGNTALALVLTVTTNLLGAVILPVTVTWMVSVFYAGNPPSDVIQVNAADLCLSLVFSVLIPLVIGIVMRQIERISKLIVRFAFKLKLASAILLALIPWMKISQSANTFSQVGGDGYVLLIIASTALHFWLLLLCAGVAFLSLNKSTELADIKCLVLAGAQKTMPVALSVLELLPVGIGGNSGLIALSLVIMQLIQTLVDSALALQWEARTRSPPPEVAPPSKDIDAEAQQVESAPFATVDEAGHKEGMNLKSEPSSIAQ